MNVQLRVPSTPAWWTQTPAPDTHQFLHRILGKWARSSVNPAAPCWELQGPREGSLTPGPGSGPHAEGFCSPLAVFPGASSVSPCAGGVGLLPAAAASVSPWGDYEQGAHIPDATYPEEGGVRQSLPKIT